MDTPWTPLDRDAAERTRLENLRHPEVAPMGVQVVVLPVGSTEPHANHLPYATDTWIAGGLAARAAARANAMGARVVVLPTMPYGVNTNITTVPLAQSIRPATMMAFVADLAETLERQGIRKLVILNGHGGNATTLAAALRELHGARPRMFAALVHAWSPYAAELREIIETPGDHAAEEETSVALALFPEKVRMDLAVRARDSELALESLKQRYVEFVRPWQYVSDNTGTGDPARATPEKGGKLVDLFLERVALFLKELSDAELTERFPFR